MGKARMTKQTEEMKNETDPEKEKRIWNLQKDPRSCATHQIRAGFHDKCQRARTGSGTLKPGMLRKFHRTPERER
jgi:hypothetical protein